MNEKTIINKLGKPNFTENLEKIITETTQKTENQNPFNNREPTREIILDTIILCTIIICTILHEIYKKQVITCT